MNGTLYDTIIVGAGISGLTLAQRLKSAGLSILVLEADSQVGGVMKSDFLDTPNGKIPIELGPNTVPSSAKEFLSLSEEVGLEAIESSDSAQKRYIFLQGQLTSLPSSPLSFLTSPILSLFGKLKLLQDLYMPVQSDKEISISDFFEKRFGQELVDNIITPALTGIYAGNPKQMSLQATFPFLAEWEQESGSVIKGAIQAMKRRKQLSTPSQRSKQKLLSFQDGIGAFPMALAKKLGHDVVRLNAVVTNIQKIDQQYQVQTVSDTYQARSVVLTTPAETTSRLLIPLAPNTSELLLSIPYAPMNLVHLVFEKEALPFQWDGFGFLVPRKQSQSPYITLLGGIWNSSLFPDKYPSDIAVATHFQGGMFHPEISELSDDELVQKTLQDLKTVYQTDALIPVFTRVTRWPKAIPQYTLGHKEKIAHLTSVLEETLPQFYLLGNYQNGVSLNDCVKNANELSTKIIHQLRLESPHSQM